MERGFIYLLESIETSKYYLGSTNNPPKRINQHNNGLVTATKQYIPWRCLLIISIDTLIEARKVEYYIIRYTMLLRSQNVVKILNWYFENNGS